MLRRPSRLKHSDDADPLARALLSAGQPTRALPESSRMRGERRVARLASAPIVGLGVGLLSKAAAAGFGLGVVSAVAVVTGVPAVRARMLVWRELAAPPAEMASGPVGRREPVAGSPASSPDAPVEPPVVEAAADALPTASPATQVPAKRRHLEPPPEASSDDLPPTPPADVPSSTAAEDRSVSAELSILLEARRQLASDPGAALATLGRHSASFPGGALAMEREVLMIEALGRSGQRPEAARRAREMLAQSPNPFYAGRLKQVIADE